MHFVIQWEMIKCRILLALWKRSRLTDQWLIATVYRETASTMLCFIISPIFFAFRIQNHFMNPPSKFDSINAELILHQSLDLVRHGGLFSSSCWRKMSHAVPRNQRNSKSKLESIPLLTMPCNEIHYPKTADEWITPETHSTNSEGRVQTSREVLEGAETF